MLRRAGEHFEVIANGTFLMDTRDGRSERALVREAIAGKSDVRLLLAGLGVGFSLDEALRADAVAEVVVVELEAAVVGWVRTHMRGLTEHGLNDPRVRLRVADIRTVLRAAEDEFDAICLDVDNGPGWLVHEANAGVYADATLALIRRRLLSGGPQGPRRGCGRAARLRRRFAAVATVSIPVARGPDDVVYVATTEGA